MSSCEQKDFINKHFQNPATFCLFPGFESQIVYVITDVVLVFALLLAAENSSDYSVSRESLFSSLAGSYPLRKEQSVGVTAKYRD